MKTSQIIILKILITLYNSLWNEFLKMYPAFRRTVLIADIRSLYIIV